MIEAWLGREERLRYESAMGSEPLPSVLMIARAAFEEAEAAARGQEQSLRDALAKFQQVIISLRSGAPVVREEDERFALEFLLATDAQSVDAGALEFAVELLRLEANALLSERETQDRRRGLRGWRGPVELVGPVMALLVLVLAGYTLAQRALKPVDLAEGKPWVASSSWATCTPKAGRCGPLTSRILFHTAEDESPWFRIDLGVATRFSSATIVNRADDAPERAVPLLLEVGDDGEHFREIARRESQFSVWRATFPSVTGRFVRVRIPRKTWLHLEAVKLHP